MTVLSNNDTTSPVNLNEFFVFLTLNSILLASREKFQLIKIEIKYQHICKDKSSSLKRITLSAKKRWQYMANIRFSAIYGTHQISLGSQKFRVDKIEKSCWHTMHTARQRHKS